MTQQYDPWNQQPVPPQQQWGNQPPPGAWQQPGQYQPPGYGPQYPPPGPPQRQPGKTNKGLIAGLGCGGLVVLFLIVAVIAGANSSSSSSAPASGPLQTLAVAPLPSASGAAPVHSAAAAKAPAAETVTFQVEGSPADVTYGPAGSNFSGSVPLNVTQPLGTPIYYAITAQLQGGGQVSCRILVDGKVISQSTASGGYNIADCEISQGFTGGWHNTMG